MMNPTRIILCIIEYWLQNIIIIQQEKTGEKVESRPLIDLLTKKGKTVG